MLPCGESVKLYSSIESVVVPFVVVPGVVFELKMNVAAQYAPAPAAIPIMRPRRSPRVLSRN
jgi:hypothetical protein